MKRPPTARGLAEGLTDPGGADGAGSALAAALQGSF